MAQMLVRKPNENLTLIFTKNTLAEKFFKTRCAICLLVQQHPVTNLIRQELLLLQPYPPMISCQPVTTKRHFLTLLIRLRETLKPYTCGVKLLMLMISSDLILSKQRFILFGHTATF